MIAKQIAAAKNRKAVGRLFCIARFLARLDLAFRGHDESVGSKNRGIFREVVALLSDSGDEVLKEHL